MVSPMRACDAASTGVSDEQRTSNGIEIIARVLEQGRRVLLEFTVFAFLFLKPRVIRALQLTRLLHQLGPRTVNRLLKPAPRHRGRCTISVCRTSVARAFGIEGA